MTDQGSDDDQRRDALLLRLLKMPPQTRAETAERARRAKGKQSTQTRGKRASAAQRELSVLSDEKTVRRPRAHKGRSSQ
jgi:hypothetical protein